MMTWRRLPTAVATVATSRTWQAMAWKGEKARKVIIYNSVLVMASVPELKGLCSAANPWRHLTNDGRGRQMKLLLSRGPARRRPGSSAICRPESSTHDLSRVVICLPTRKSRDKWRAVRLLSQHSLQGKQLLRSTANPASTSSERPSILIICRLHRSRANPLMICAAAPLGTHPAVLNMGTGGEEQFSSSAPASQMSPMLQVSPLAL